MKAKCDYISNSLNPQVIGNSLEFGKNLNTMELYLDIQSWKNDYLQFASMFNSNYGGLPCWIQRYQSKMIFMLIRLLICLHNSKSVVDWLVEITRDPKHEQPFLMTIALEFKPYSLKTQLMVFKSFQHTQVESQDNDQLLLFQVCKIFLQIFFEFRNTLLMMKKNLKRINAGPFYPVW
ncbi:unnamed protein product [Paramecium pentaurelia]|uniref:Uncharacterized protein n=1 Tax=Paramecium pentaurelia TaxID=43138 RepID=A0A8S1YGE5_9CILI|nr:unnamed protein product [Paramecium pentaurelia]